MKVLRGSRTGLIVRNLEVNTIYSEHELSFCTGVVTLYNSIKNKLLLQRYFLKAFTAADIHNPYQTLLTSCTYYFHIVLYKVEI